MVAVHAIGEKDNDICNASVGVDKLDAQTSTRSASRMIRAIGSIWQGLARMILITPKIDLRDNGQHRSGQGIVLPDI